MQEMMNVSVKIEKVILEETPGDEETLLEFHFRIAGRENIEKAVAGYSILECMDRLQGMGIYCEEKRD
jgi:hypothetical protein